MRLSEQARLTVPLAQSPVIYSCVRVNADSFAGLPLQVFDSEEEDAEPLEKTDPLVALLGKWNPLMGGRKGQRAVSVALDMAGGIFFFLALRGGKPIGPNQMPEEIWPVRDDLVEPVRMHRQGPDGKTFLDPIPVAWKTKSGDGEVIFPDHAVAHVYYPDDQDLFRGFGPLQASWRSADHLFRAEAFDDGLVENGGQIGGIFTHEANKLTPQQLDTLQKRVDQNTSTPRQNRKKLVMPSGIGFTATAWAPVDMDAKEMRIAKRQEIARTFGVPPVMLGELEDANRSSLRELRRVYYENTVVPRADFVMEELREQLIPRLPKEFADYRIKLDYASTPAMREDVDAQIARMKELVGMGVPVGIAAKAVGLALDEAPADDRYLSTSLRPMAVAMAMPSGPESDEDEDEKPPKPAKSIEKSTRDRRAAAVAAEEKRLAKADRRVKQAVRQTFDDFILRQLAKVREVAAGAGKSRRGVRPWTWWTEAAQWTPDQRAYADLLDYRPALGSEGMVEVRSITEDELASILVQAERLWGEELWSKVEGPLKGVIQEAAQAASANVGGELLQATDQAVVRYLAQKQIKLVEGPMSVVAEQVKRALIAGMSEAPTSGTLADRVREALESVESELRTLQDRLGTRAAMIARTETAAASNMARVEQFRAAGVVQHEWASAGDDLVRDGHDIDGELAIVGQPFSNGLRLPGDPNGTAEMVVGCRCLTVAVIPT